ncbi:hypothetical protein PILCRDRAFT_159710 [Piloderma croceum F 1598]|uniref:Transcription factor IIIC subunit 5 HTH domain-containing protein n=1 Tax=Piloderma croceum (strain F 1598) TaxID=765440 RepID=A0A0C3G3X4_PILCF|nr:hypothetical protein PILCRDRAFT_159710 [Piloderma croceum F 1598]
MMQSESPTEAPEHPLPSTQLFSVEYPGYVRPASIPLAINNLGGQSSLHNAFKRTASKTDALLELRLRPDNPFAHPVPGDVVGTSNVLLRVVKRKRRRVEGQDVPLGEYTAEAVGVVSKTVRFRSMVDYQYQIDLNDPVAKLRLAMDNMDVEAIQQYSIPEEKEDYTLPANPVLDPQLVADSKEPQSISGQRSNLRLFPPPLFSRQGISQNYNFKANPSSMISTTIDEETGEEKRRLINKGRWKGYGPASIMFVEQTLPDKPPQIVEEMRSQVDQELLKRLQELFQERAIWTRMSLLNQFSPPEARDVHNSKLLLPLVCYVFQDGPWRDTLVRFSYDPRKDPNARSYQRLYFRNANHPIARPSVITRREGRGTASSQSRADDEGIRRDADRRKSHIFDGVNIAKETASFQLCDIHDRMLMEMIQSEDDLRDVCNERDGWYSAHAFEQIKTVLRHKFFSLLEGHIPTDEECEALLVVDPTSNKATAVRSKKLRPGKHNMAKGALRPEDAAAARLRATLDRNAKTLQSQRGIE